jgi:hypothetical protein
MVEPSRVVDVIQTLCQQIDVVSTLKYGAGLMVERQNHGISAPHCLATSHDNHIGPAIEDGFRTVRADETP